MVTVENLKYIYFDDSGINFDLSKADDKGRLEGKEYTDFTCGDEFKYVGYYAPKNRYCHNNHHIKTSRYYDIIIPKLDELLHFGYNKDDFKLIPNFSSNGEFDVSYLYPKNDEKEFIFSLNDNIWEGPFSILIDNDSKVSDGETAYHKLFSGSHQCSMIANNGENNGKSIIISGDSMLIPVIPIICYYYRAVVFLDNRDGKTHKQWFDNLTFDDGIIEYFGNDIYSDKKEVDNFK